MRIFFLLSFVTFPTFAYVAGTSSMAKGDVELTMKAELMRGLAGPENLPETQQTQRPSVNIYEVGAGYSFGTASVFQDVKARFTGARFTSAEELLGGSQVYAKNDGWILGLELSTNFLHEVDKVFGVFARIQHPIDMNVAKFVNPKVDRIGLGIQSAFKFSDNFGQEMVIFLGSGLKQSGFKQNASISVSLLGALILSEGIFKNGAALKLGPFYDGDLGERSDAAYGTIGVRAFRVGVVAVASYSVTKNLSLEFSYIQKVSGAYFRATKDYVFSIRSVL